MTKQPKFSYKIVLSYKGAQYCGWQNQTTNPETVQNYVEKVIEKIAKYQDFQVIGASRTDSGVHASGQALKVTLPREVSPENLLMGMNSKLPSDIKVVSCEFTDEKLNINRDPKFKEYHYYFTINANENALLSEISYPYPKELDQALMQQACTILVGEHNFISFCTPGPHPPKPFRSILECSIQKTNFLTLGQEIFYLKIKGTGFLRHMVRILMGAIWDIGSHALTLEDFSLSLATGEKHGERTKAPAHGLHLIHIEY